MQTPPLRNAARYPLTLLIALLSIALTLLWWSNRDLNALIAQRVIVLHRPWTLVTSAFLHLDLIHLAFNLFWWWRFGTILERNWGRARLVGVFLLLAVFSGLAEVVFSRPGVGLSGVIYGLWTLLAVLEKRRPAFAGAVTAKTNQAFCTWFILCVVATAAGLWNVGNVAHGAGAAGGWLLGRAIVAERRGRAGFAAALVALCGVFIAGTFPATPWLRLAHVKGEDAYYGALAVQRGEFERGVALLESARKNGEANDAALVNLGAGYQGLGRNHEALEIYRELQRTGSKYVPNVREAAAGILADDAEEAADRGDLVRVRSLVNEILRWEPSNEWARKMQKWLDEEGVRPAETP